MKLRTAFAKDIQRPINGVIKADQSDQAYNELDEYVITKEIDKHLRKFVSAYLSGIARSNDPSTAAQMAVWVSGFFGSGKSHLIKILSYLLANHPVSDGKDKKLLLDFFLEKVLGDAAFADDLRKLAAAKTEVILFNIDSKAEQNHNRDPVLRVFLRVFNEHCASMPVQRLGCGPDRFKRPFQCGEQLLSGCRQRDAAICPVDQSDTDPCLQALNTKA